MRELESYFIEQAGKIENTTVHGLKDEGSAPHIISLGIAGIRSEVLPLLLEDKVVCLIRICMCIESSGSKRGSQKHWGSTGISGCDDSFQYVRIYYKRRN